MVQTPDLAHCQFHFFHCARYRHQTWICPALLLIRAKMKCWEAESKAARALPSHLSSLHQYTSTPRPVACESESERQVSKHLAACCGKHFSDLVVQLVVQSLPFTSPDNVRGTGIVRLKSLLSMRLRTNAQRILCHLLTCIQSHSDSRAQCLSLNLLKLLLQNHQRFVISRNLNWIKTKRERGKLTMEANLNTEIYKTNLKRPE